MNILIAYSSGYGVTQEVAEKIGQILTEERTFQVQVESIDNVSDVTLFDTIVLGSSVRADHPLVNIMDFLSLHRQSLDKKKISIFLVCLMANCGAGRELVKHDYLTLIYEKFPELNYVSNEAFGGKIDFDKLNPVMQMLMERVLEKTGIPTKGSVDTRDWNFITSWAQELKGKLLTA